MFFGADGCRMRPIWPATHAKESRGGDTGQGGEERAKLDLEMGLVEPKTSIGDQWFVVRVCSLGPLRIVII
jgi:hypothetical protein